MFKSLRVKFLLLLLGVVILSLSGSIVFRGLMINDFNDYLDGEGEDKVYRILAHLEGSFERNRAWNKETEAQNALWILNLGFEMRLKDTNDAIVMDTDEAFKGASSSVKRRLESLSDYRTGGGELIPYPLFLGGTQIGTLELRRLPPSKLSVFIHRSDLFLVLSVIVIGGIAALLSILFARRLTGPIIGLARVAKAISDGDFTQRVTALRNDEVGELSAAFNRMVKDLEMHEMLRRKLIADVAHELRTPLGVMRGEIEAMMDGMIPVDSERLQSLYDETGRLKNMVDGIEELNRAEASALLLERKMCALKPFLNHIAVLFDALLAEKGVDLEVRCDDDHEVYADPERLSQIVLNLLSNALKATPAGGRIVITAKRTGKETTITFEDTGSGIREEDLPFIFQRFYKGSGGGLGIGLTIVKELAEAHGGKVEAANTDDHGARFTVYLPVRGLHNSS